MLKIGLTGGIGSGKSFVSRIFKSLGIAVYDSDEAARKIMKENEEVVKGVKKLFGSKAYDGNQLNSSFISKQVFKDNLLLSSLNSLVHPVVQNDFEKWLGLQTIDCPYVIKEAAILFETGAYKLLDYNILLIADEQVRIKRVMERDQISEDRIRERINNQMSDEEKRIYADFIISNDIDSMILQQIVDLHNNFLSKQIN